MYNCQIKNDCRFSKKELIIQRSNEGKWCKNSNECREACTQERCRRQMEFLVAIMAASQRMDELREAVYERTGHGKRDNGADLRVLQ